MRTSTLTTITARSLAAVLIFSAASAVGGAVALWFTRGLGMPLSLLEGSPFPSFAGPALILAVIIGGTHTLAAILVLRHRVSSLLWSAVAGFSVVIWIMVETVIIHGFSWLQGLYFTAGIAELALVFGLLGIVSWLSARDVA
ncbi:hypothetical protein [Salinibacterium sp.]|uniref:hypothetical protein n=1 Tax=Salinibacterium sp. TaxID=1915057 RepID=UPI00286BC289|nr:hypothetical protein [Salinibacterium sp.]